MRPLRATAALGLGVVLAACGGAPVAPEIPAVTGTSATTPTAVPPMVRSISAPSVTDPRLVPALPAALVDSAIDPERRNKLAVELVQAGGAEATAVLRAMLEDPTETPRWRNYCVQHLADMAIRHRDAEALATVVAACEATEPIVAEVAWFSLARIAADGGEAVPDTARRLLDGASDPWRPQLVRVSAIRGLAYLQAVDQRRQVEDLALDADQPLVVRVAAIQALAELGNAQTLERLGSLEPTGTGMLARSHVSTVARLTSRFASDDPR